MRSRSWVPRSPTVFERSIVTRTLLLTLAGPHQAWGTRSRFATRSTERAPTRSGVLGLVAAAFGMDRTEPLDRFVAVRFGVRIDAPGLIERDFQTARTLDGKQSMPLSQRYFLSDAVFLAALESEDTALIDEIRDALRQPKYPLYLGRRAFPPAGPIATGIVSSDLRTALREAPWQVSAFARQNAPASLEVLVDAQPGEQIDFSLEDDPISFDPRRRKHAWRDLHMFTVTPPGLVPSTPDAPQRRRGFVPPLHDPLLLTSDEEV